MKKQEWIEWVVKETNMSKKDAKAFLEKMFEAVITNVKKDEVQMPLIGKFVIVNRKERKGRNPKTGETITIKASKKLKFKPSKEFKESVQ